jgi:hypothetical protein
MSSVFNESDTEYLYSEDIAKMFGIKRKTAVQWMHKMPGATKIGNRLRISRLELARYVDKQKSEFRKGKS